MAYTEPSTGLFDRVRKTFTTTTTTVEEDEMPMITGKNGEVLLDPSLAAKPPVPRPAVVQMRNAPSAPTPAPTVYEPSSSSMTPEQMGARSPPQSNPTEFDNPYDPREKRIDKFRRVVTKMTDPSVWRAVFLIAMSLIIVTTFVMVCVIATESVEVKSGINQLGHVAEMNLGALLAFAKFFQISHIVDDMHSKDVQCLTLLAECASLANSGLNPGDTAQLQHICNIVVERCEREVANHLEHLAGLSFDAGNCVTIFPGEEAFCYPQIQVTSATTLDGLRYDRVGPSSAAFGPLSAPAKQSMLNRREYGLYVAYSFYDIPGAGAMRDGVSYVSLDVRSPAFGRASVMLETQERGWIHSFYVDHERVLALGLESNKIYHWDISTSLALATPGTTITGPNMLTGTASANGALSRPWSIRRLENGDYVVSMLDSTSTECVGDAQFCGGLMRLSNAQLISAPAAAPSRFDSVTDPLFPTRHTPGDCAVLGGGRSMVVCGSYGSYDQVLAPNCYDPDSDIFGVPAWGAQVNIFSGSGSLLEQKDLIASPLVDLTPIYAPKPVEAWRNVSGYIPNRIVQYHGVNDAFIVVDTFGGSIIGMTWDGSSPSSVWNGAVAAWILPIGGDASDLGDAEAYTSPLITDAILSPDNCLLFIASPSLGQVRVYSLCNADGNGLPSPVLCAIHQLTAGLTGSTITYTHASNPSRPLYGGPANLAITPDGEYLYVSSSSVFDDCLFPEAIEAGGFIVRYRISTAQCSALSLDIDGGFFVDGNALPGRSGVPARLGTVAFSSGDGRLQQVDRDHGF